MQHPYNFFLFFTSLIVPLTIPYLLLFALLYFTIGEIAEREPVLLMIGKSYFKYVMWVILYAVAATGILHDSKLSKATIMTRYFAFPVLYTGFIFFRNWSQTEFLNTMPTFLLWISVSIYAAVIILRSRWREKARPEVDVEQIGTLSVQNKD